MPLKPSVARRLRDARDALEEARHDRDDAIIEAFHSGGSMHEIGDAVGMSHVGVAKLLERLGVRKRWQTLADANREMDERERKAARPPPRDKR